MKTLLTGFASLLLMAFLAPTQAADFDPLDFSHSANFNRHAQNPLYPTGTFLTRFAVPFEIPTTGNNAWGSGDGLGGSCFCNDGVFRLEIPVNRQDVKTIYTLADTDWGSAGLQSLSLTAYFDNGGQATWQYVDGQHLRDWNMFSAFSNSINHTDTNEVFRISPPLQAYDGNPDIVDMQTLSVPEEFHDAELQRLVFTDTRQSVGGIHSAIIAGVTTSNLGPVTAAIAAIPEPESLALLIAGLVAIGIAARRQCWNRQAGMA